MFKRFLSLALMLFAAAITASAQAQTTTISWTAYRPNGEPRANAIVAVSEIIKDGAVISRGPVYFRTNSSGVLLNTDGTPGAKMIRNSIARIYADAPGFNDTPAGVYYVIPDAPTANLESLQRWVTGTYYVTTTTGNGFALQATSLTTGNALTITVPNSGFTGNALQVRKSNGTNVFSINGAGLMTVGNVVTDISALTEETTIANGDYVQIYRSCEKKASCFSSEDEFSRCRRDLNGRKTAIDSEV